MIAFLLSPLGLRILAGLALAALLAGIVWAHDAKVRKKEAERWQPKLEQCELSTKTATDANTKLTADYKAFIDAHNAQMEALAKETKRKLAERDKALAALGVARQADQEELARLRAEAAAGPLPTTEESCAKATATLRSLARELRDDAGH